MGRFLFYSHDGLGLGHTRRNLAIAEALGELSPGCAILMATGIEDFKQFGIPPCVDILKLPGLRKVANGAYAARRLRIRRREIVQLRSDLLRSAVESFRPDVLLVDKHPFGAAGELHNALLLHRAREGRCALGLRDILDDAETVLREWRPFDLPNRIVGYYDTVLVYGQREIFDLAAEYRFSALLVSKTRYCGYVLNRTRKEYRASDSPEPFLMRAELPVVLATPGGGEDGTTLLQTFIAASRGAPWRAVIVTGPQLPDERHRALRDEAREEGVGFRAFVPGLHNWFGSVDVVVSMGGYNTVVETVFSGTPSICVPRSSPRVEQLLRARAFNRLGLLRCLDPSELTPLTLRASILRALAAGRRPADVRPTTVKFDGAQRAAQELISLAESAEKTKLLEEVVE